MSGSIPTFWRRAGALFGRNWQSPDTDGDTGLLLRSPNASGRSEVQAESALEGGVAEQAGQARGAAVAHGAALEVAGTSGSPATERLECVDVHVDVPSAGNGEALETGNNQKPGRQGSTANALGSESSDGFPTCLICLEPMDTGSAHVAPLGCQCKGPAAYRHRACLERWLQVKGDTTCDVCRTEMTAVSLPPPPPVPGYVVFPQLDHSFDVQWETFGRYMWHNTVAIFVYCIVFALVMDIRLYVALLIAALMVLGLLLRYVVTVAINTLARRTVLSFQAPDPLTGG